MKTLDNILNEELKDSTFKSLFEYESLIQEIALQIAKFRKELGMSQNELAEKIGTKQQVISRIEGGNQNISIQMLLKISNVLGQNLKISF